MRVRVRLFAVYREQAGTERLTLEVPEGASPSDVFAQLQERFPRLRPSSERLGVAVNMEYQDPSVPLREGDEVVFVPPVSGGGVVSGGGAVSAGGPAWAGGPEAGASQEQPAVEGTTVSQDARFRLSQAPLDPRRVEALVADEALGGVVTFQGRVRSPNRGHQVVHLEYEAFGPMAIREMERIDRQVRERWPEVRLAIEHRVGRAEPGEPTVCIAAASPHRGEAFEACRYAIDALKERVPIWKKEIWTDGQEWVRPGEGHDD